MLHARTCVIIVALILGGLPGGSFAQSAKPAQAARGAADPLAAIEAAVAAAEHSLQSGELQIAESRYRTALLQGWMTIGALRLADGALADARDAFQRASTSAVDVNEALQSLAIVNIQMGAAADAVAILTPLATTHPRDLALQRLLAQAMVASGHPEQAVQTLEEARAAAPDDPEVAFLLASGYLRLKKIEPAERLFAEIVRAKPMAQTYVLIGRTYRDAGEYGRARTALDTALKKDPRVRRAHYYLGTVAVMESGVVRLDEAIAQFQQELRLAPQDPVTNLRLGMALVEAHRETEALPALELSARSSDAPPDAFHYLGRCQLALKRPTEAVAALRRALALSQGPVVDETRVGNIHYQLALALRQLGRADEAAAEFAEAQRSSAKRADSLRERLARYLADVPDPQAANVGGNAAANAALPVSLPFDASPFSTLTAPQRAALTLRVTATLVRAYFNLGVMQAQGGRFARAAEFFEQAAALDPAFPQLQYSLGVAYFTAHRFDKAAEPLSRALAADRTNAAARRMLALAWLETEVYDKAADLLKDDPQRDADPSLQYAYGLALVRSNRAADAERIFSGLLAAHTDMAELHVVLGQAHAQQGDFNAAIQSLQHALQLKPDVLDANATLGVIYLKQGKLPEAAAALRAELKSHADDYKSRHNLATVLELDGHADEAIAEARTVLRVKPDFADARYLLGKILLAQGAAQEAVAHLEVAVRLSPDSANIHYQLGQAYQKLGQTALAQQQFAAFQQLKDQRRGRTPTP
jgi:tetratricopeptide (TPR) repeat protein